MLIGTSGEGLGPNPEENHNPQQPVWWPDHLKFVEGGRDGEPGVYLGTAEDGRSIWVYNLDESGLSRQHYDAAVEQAKQVGSEVLFIGGEDGNDNGGEEIEKAGDGE